MRVKAPVNHGISVLIRKDARKIDDLSLPGEHIVRRQPSAKQERGHTRN